MKSKEPKTEKVPKDHKDHKVKKDEKDDRKSFPLRLSKETLKALKLKALEGDTSVQKILEGLIEAHLGNGGTSS